MTYLSEEKQAILHLLLDGPLSQIEIAQQLKRSSFTVHAELKDLRRDRLVTDQITGKGHKWRLTDRGAGVSGLDDQLSLEVS